MGKTFRHEANPERVARVQELRRSSAAGPTNRKTTRRNAKEAAIMEDYEENYGLNDERYESAYDEGYDDYMEE